MHVDEIPQRLTRSVDQLRDRTAGMVAPDAGSTIKEISALSSRVGRVGRDLDQRIEVLHDDLGSRISALHAEQRATSWPRRLFWMLAGMAAGAGASYLADPDRGRSRRAQLEDQMRSRARHLADDARRTATDAANRAKGQVVEAVKDAMPDTPEEDPALLQQRIRSEVFGGRSDVADVVLRVDAPGAVSLKGTVPSSDTEQELLAQVAEVDGVIDVSSELSVRHS